MVLALVAGCATTRGGPVSFMQHAEAKSENIAMKALLAAPTEEERNTQLRKAMSDVDIFYLAYRDELLRQDNMFNASVDLVSLLGGLAGGLTSSAGVKDTYLTLGALLTGGRATINNRFLHAQTTLALINGMDAARARTALAIRQRQSVGGTIQEYPGRDAYTDVIKYYFDGTLAGGLNWLQSNAQTQEKAATNAMDELRLPTPQEYQARSAFRIEVDDRLLDVSAKKLLDALTAWSIAHAPGTSRDDLQLAFQRELGKRLREGQSPAALREQLAEAKFFED